MLFCCQTFGAMLDGKSRSLKDHMKPPHPQYLGPTAHVLFSQPCHSPAVGSWEAKQMMCEDLWLEIAHMEMPGLWDHCFCGGEGVWPCWLLADPSASVSTHLSAAALTQYPDVWERERERERGRERSCCQRREVRHGSVRMSKALIYVFGAFLLGVISLSLWLFLTTETLLMLLLFYCSLWQIRGSDPYLTKCFQVLQHCCLSVWFCKARGRNKMN